MSMFDRKKGLWIKARFIDFWGSQVSLADSMMLNIIELIITLKMAGLNRHILSRFCCTPVTIDTSTSYTLDS